MNEQIISFCEEQFIKFLYDITLLFPWAQVFSK
jgi:hypothetical protein